MKEDLHHIEDLFGLRKIDFTNRIPETSEMFTPIEAGIYIEGCDFPESVDDLLLAWEIMNVFGPLDDKLVLDSMCGPGRLGRELVTLGAGHVVFHDGDPVMLNHAMNQAKIVRPVSSLHKFKCDVAELRPANSFDLVVCHNSTHQLANIDRLCEAVKGFVRVTKPGGHVFIADYQRDSSPEFLSALEERLKWTKPEIVPLLVPTFLAAFSKAEFETVLQTIPGISWQISDAARPILSVAQQLRVDLDPVKGHLMDFSPISQRIIIQKEE